MRSKGIGPNLRYRSATVQTLRGGRRVEVGAAMAESWRRRTNDRGTEPLSYHGRRGPPIAAEARLMGTKTPALWYSGSRFKLDQVAPKRGLHRRKSQLIPPAKGRTLRQIGTVPKGLDAKAFSDYLLSVGMKTRI